MANIADQTFGDRFVYSHAVATAAAAAMLVHMLRALMFAEFVSRIYVRPINFSRCNSSANFFSKRLLTAQALTDGDDMLGAPWRRSNTFCGIGNGGSRSIIRASALHFNN